MNFSAFFISLLMVASPLTFTTTSKTATTATVDVVEESDFIVGVFVFYEDGTSELIEQKAVPGDMDFETINEQGEHEPSIEKLNTLLTTKDLKTYQGKKIAASRSFFGSSTCGRKQIEFFVYKCYVPNIPGSFSQGCWDGGTYCACAAWGNTNRYPCYVSGCQNLFIWCNNV